MSHILKIIISLVLYLVIHIPTAIANTQQICSDDFDYKGCRERCDQIKSQELSECLVKYNKCIDRLVLTNWCEPAYTMCEINAGGKHVACLQKCLDLACSTPN